MYCSACGRENGVFSARCRNCGQFLVGPQRWARRGRHRSSWVATVGAVIGGGSTIALLVLIVLITRQNLWSQVLDPEAAAVPTPIDAARTAVALASVDQLPIAAGSGAVPSTLGTVNASGDWRIRVDGFEVRPDDTVNGWSQVVVTCTFQNAGTRPESLQIPMTGVALDLPATPVVHGPSFQPISAVPENAPSVVNGLRLYLLDSGRRPFGGGFGSAYGGYHLIQAPGDLTRLTYQFRFPSNVGPPAILRMVFPVSGGGRAFEVHLDRRDPNPAALGLGAAPRAPVGQPVLLGGGWTATLDGVEFGPDPGQGERPVTVYLQVENLTDSDRPALTDPGDPDGVLRDFYLTDGAGDLAYSHMDDMPGVTVPAHASRPVAVVLYTLDLASSTRPLYFTAILNWRTNQYARFQVN